MATKSEREAWKRIHKVLAAASAEIESLRLQIYRLRLVGDPKDVVFQLKDEARKAAEFASADSEAGEVPETKPAPAKPAPAGTALGKPTPGGVTPIRGETPDAASPDAASPDDEPRTGTGA